MIRSVAVKLMLRCFSTPKSFAQCSNFPCIRRSEAVKSVLVLASFERPLTSSGPVRYVRKPQPDQVTDRGRSLFDRGDAQGKDQGEPQFSEDDGNGESRTNRNHEKRKTSWRSQKTGQNPSIDPATRQSSYVVKSPSKISKPILKKVDDGFQKKPELDAESTWLFPAAVHKLETSSVSELFTQETPREGLPVHKSGTNCSNHDPFTSAKEYAIALLARGLQTETNLRGKLTRKNFEAHVIDKTISDLQKWGLQSDKEYADAFARLRLKDNTWGPNRIRYALLKKGLIKEIIDAAIVDLFEKSDDLFGNEESDGNLVRWGMTKEASEHIMAQARRRWSQGNMELEVRRRRMVGWLQRRGYSWTQVSDILDTLFLESQ